MEIHFRCTFKSYGNSVLFCIDFKCQRRESHSRLYSAPLTLQHEFLCFEKNKQKTNKKNCVLYCILGLRVEKFPGMCPHSSHNSYNISTPFLLAYQAISGANILYHRQHHLHATFLNISFLLHARLRNGQLHCIGYINQCLDIFEHLGAFSFGFFTDVTLVLLLHPTSCLTADSVKNNLHSIKHSFANMLCHTWWTYIHGYDKLWRLRHGGRAEQTCLVEFWESGSGWRAQTHRSCRVS